jgi:hypothetical protein
MRHLTILFILAGALAAGLLASATPALAIDTKLAKATVDEVKAVCEKVGGRFSQDAKGYGCGTNCHGGAGTACIVNCREGERCVAQMTRGRRPHNLESALVPGGKKH